MKRRIKAGGNAASAKPRPAQPARNQRLQREERERHIVQEAIRFFA